MQKKWIAILIIFGMTQLLGMDDEIKDKLKSEQALVEAKLSEKPNQSELCPRFVLWRQ